MDIIDTIDNLIKFHKPAFVESVYIEHEFSYDDDCRFDIELTLYEDAFITSVKDIFTGVSGSSFGSVGFACLFIVILYVFLRPLPLVTTTF